MKARMTVLAAISTIILFASACSPVAGATQEAKVQVSYDEIAGARHVVKTVTVNEGSRLVIELPSNPSTGFDWNDPVLSDETILDLANSSFDTPEGGVLGASGTQIWTFEATGKGTTRVKADYSRPWEGGEKAEWSIEVTVIVQ